MTFIVPPSSNNGSAVPIRPTATPGNIYSVNPGTYPIGSPLGAGNTLYILPFYLIDGETVASFLLQNVSGGASLVRLGLYENDGFSRPTELINDFGTLNVPNGTTGALTVNFPAPFTGWFFLAYTSSQFTYSAIPAWPWHPSILSGLSRIAASIISGPVFGTPPTNPLPTDLTGNTLAASGAVEPAIMWMAG